MSIGLLSNFLKVEDPQLFMSMRKKRRLFSTFFQFVCSIPTQNFSYFLERLKFFCTSLSGFPKGPSARMLTETGQWEA